MSPLKFTLLLAFAAFATIANGQDAPTPKTRDRSATQRTPTAGKEPTLSQHTRVSRSRETGQFSRIEEAVELDAAPQLVTRLGESVGAGDFAEVARDTDAIGMTHVTYQQTHRGVPVEGHRYVVHARDGRVQTVTGSAVAVPAKLDVEPAISAEDALEAALQDLGVEVPMWETRSAPRGYTKPEGELVVFADPRSGRTTLTYKFDVYSGQPLYRAWVYVDALSGRVVFEDERLHHVDEVIPAESLYNGTVDITADRGEDGAYSLAQTSTGGGVYTLSLRNADPFADTSAYANAVLVSDDDLPFSNNPTAVSAHYGAEQTYAYYFERFGRRSYDDADAALVSYVNAGVDYVNAFWDGQRMTYGDGDSTNFGPLTTLDVSAHELTHGVTEYSAGLVYAYESGALNESFSDIFGEEVEYYATGEVDWLVGEEFATAEGQALRSMSAPNTFGDPDTYLGESWYLQVGDQGGVHINSGVQNYWYYLLVEGGEGVNDFGAAFSVEGIGHDKAAAIAYRNLTVYLGPFSEFFDAREGAIQAAADLFGADSPEATACAAAWDAVGVTGERPDLTCVDAPTTVVLTVTTDGRGEETSWQVTGPSSFPLFSGDRLAANTTYVDTLALSGGQYDFRVLDAVGDGFCCSSGQGSYTFTTLAGEVLAQGSEFAVADYVRLCVGGPADTTSPGTPENFVAVDSTSTTIAYEWDAPSDDFGVAGYAVFYQGRFLTTTANTSIRFNVPPEFELTLDIVAYDAAENISAFVSATGRSLPAVIATGPIATGSGEQTVFACAEESDSTEVFIRADYEVSKGALAYVIADESFGILGATGSPNLSFAGYPAGTYYVFAFNYTGNPTVRRGDNVYTTRFSDGEFLISENAVRVERVIAEAGSIALDSGGDVAYACLGDDAPDFVGFSSDGASAANFLYVVTDAENRILGATRQGYRDFSGAGVGECRVWGLSYTGDIVARLGDDASATRLSDGCFDLSDNYVTVFRDSVDGGAVASAGVEQVSANAGAPDIPVSSTSASGSPYVYFVVDPAGVIVDISRDSVVGLGGQASGQYFVYGVSYSGTLQLGVGDGFYGGRVSDACFDQSENAVVVTYTGAGSLSAQMVARRTLRLDLADEPLGRDVHTGTSAITPTSPREPASLRIVDALGNVVLTDDNVDPNGLRGLELNLPTAHPGIHFVTLIRGHHTDTRAVVVP